MVVITEENYLKHYGILRRSGRYPWGSGDNAYQRSTSFLDTVQQLKDEGLSDTAIAKSFSTDKVSFNTTDLRAAKAIARNEVRAANIAQAQRLKEKGYSNTAIGERMSINESTVRGYLAPGAADKANVLTSTTSMLRDQVDQKGPIDVGTGVELSPQLQVSRTRLNTAVKMLEQEGYEVHYVNVKQLGTGETTKIKVLGPPTEDSGQAWYKLIKDPSQIANIDGVYTEDNGRTWETIKPPQNLDSKRIKVNYADDGGADADGVIYLRPGVEDLSMGSSSYAQVRIAVDGTHYLKGMAVYKDDLPDGVDVVFNTNKRRADVDNDLATFKVLKDDPDNPFGATIKPTGQRGVLNVINEEGDWEGWSRNLATQFLSKQSEALAKTQLDVTYDRKKRELEEILDLTNPVVKQKLLDAYADGADSAAVHLKAANMPKQATHVILPVNSLKDNEIYAPNYKNGERVALVRYPHGGTFEIPELVVNNRHAYSQRILGKQARDAVGINAKVASRLSGADFDGDTVLVIPNNSGQVKSSPPLAGLKGFDPQRAYPGYPGMKKMSRTDYEMGDVSNLITDMTIKGANPTELARAVRHSMVVIDAEKHGLNYKQSSVDNGIPQLKEKYQRSDNSDGSVSKGASTIVSRAKSPERIYERKPRPAKDGGPIDRVTGKKVFVETGETYVNSKGETVRKMQRGTVPKLALAENAHDLSSGTKIEGIYADHSNRMKSLANEARREMVNTKLTKYSPSARKAYAPEVESLQSKLNLAIANRPKERAAQILANDIIKAKTSANPGMDSDERKRLRNQALAEARARTGAERSVIDITPKEWEAVQSGAVSNTKLRDILTRADLDQVKEYATPRKPSVLTPVAVRRIEALAAAGYTQAEIAADLGISTGSVSEAIAS